MRSSDNWSASFIKHVVGQLQISQCSHWLNNWIWNLIFSSSLSRNITNKNFNIILSKILKHSLSSVLSSSISMKSRGGVQQKKFHFHWPLFSMKVEICKKKEKEMNIWNCDICVWHPPTFDICHNFFFKRNCVLKQVPTHLLAKCHKIRSFFFWRLP